jgi:hypothetical protein
MRTILFRGKASLTNEWVYGNFIIRETSIGKLTEIHTGKHVYPVVLETIQQFTGQVDKNNSPIYEGDIVNVKIGGSKRVAKIEYSDNMSMFCLRYPDKNKTLNAYYFSGDNLEVIGNIIDNPEAFK